MKFLSIFSARRNADGETRIERHDGQLDIETAARLFGVPVSDLTPAVRAALGAMSGEITDLREQNSLLRKALDDAASMADHDPLVPLFNRRAFMRELSRLLSFARRYGLEASLIYFDLDGFKQINDTHGHSAGDKILVAIADALVHHTRESDLIGRIGGDEFVVVLTSLSAEAARDKASQLAHALADRVVTHDDVELSVGVSFGVTPLDPSQSAEMHVARADEAMYAEKVRRRQSRA